MSGTIHKCTTALLVLAACETGTVWAGPINFNGVFSTTNQSMWSEGSAYNYFRDTSIALTLDGSYSAGGGIAGFSAEVSANSSGSIILDYAAGVQGGTANATVPFTSQFSTASQAAGGTNFGVTLSSLQFGNDTFSTIAPIVSAENTLDLDNLSLGIGLQACAPAAGCTGASTGNSSDPYNASFTLMTLSEQTGLEMLGHKFVPADGHIFIPLGPGILDFGTYALGTPINTSGSGHGEVISSTQGYVSLVNYDFDAANFLAAVAGLPPLNGSFGVPDVASVDYNLLAAGVDFVLELEQTFFMTPSISVDLHVMETGQDIPITPGSTANLFMPSDVQSLHVEPIYTINASLENETNFCVAPTLGASALYGGVTIGDSASGTTTEGFGPAFAATQSLPSGCGSIEDSTFQLGGFNQVTGPIMEIDNSSSIDPTPEPVSFLLMGMGLAGIVGIAVVRRRKSAGVEL
jgi:hypothetical protein